MSEAERFLKSSDGRKPPGDAAVWEDAAVDVLLHILDEQHAVTTSELEARASDRTWNPMVWPWPINPHHFQSARQRLLEEGIIEVEHRGTRSHPGLIATWSRVPEYGLKRKIDDAAARKRLLTARHSGWAHRGGSGRGLIGRAGENATVAAMRQSPFLSSVTDSSVELLGVPLLGEIDATAMMIDLTSDNPTPIVLLVEVKNRRSWFYAGDDEVVRFLAKAARFQADRPDLNVLPIFVARRIQVTLWRQGEREGFLPARVEVQNVLADKRLDQQKMDEVSQGLGYSDLRLGDKPSSRHLGVFDAALRKGGRALKLSTAWKDGHSRYLDIPVNLDHDGFVDQ